MVARFTPRIGRATVRSGVSTGTAKNTLSARNAMRGIIDEMKRFTQHMEGESPEILREALEPTLTLSKIYCPKDTGELVNSAYLSETKFRGIATVEIGYGKGGRPDYAAKVHEDLEARHRAPTQAKFLQRAIEEQEPDIQQRILSRLKAASGT